MSSASWALRHGGAARGDEGAHAMIKGVCARVANRAGVPVWMPRAAFVIFGLLHWLLALIVYFVMSRIMCRNQRWDLPMAPPTPAQGAAHERFAALDRRLAEMEQATLQQEYSLRRGFRDLERR